MCLLDDASAFDQISIPNTPDTDMDETNLLSHLKTNTQTI